VHRKFSAPRTRRLAFGGMAVLAILVATITPSWADKIIADGDGDAVVGDAALAMGEVCATTGSDGHNGGNDQHLRLYVERSGNDSQRYADATDVTFSAALDANAPTGLEVSIASPDTIAIPTDWSDEAIYPNGSQLGPLVSTVRINRTILGALPGAGPERKITYTAAGSLDPKTKEVEISATIVDETTATVMDCTLPTAAIASPAYPEPTYVRDSAQNASYTCSDPARADGGGVTPSGIPTAGCVGVVTPPVGPSVAVANGAALPTDQEGTYTLTVTPKDGVGNVGSPVSRTYTVVAPAGTVWELMFERPVSQTDTGGEVSLNNIKNGRVVPIKVGIRKNAVAQVAGDGSVTIHLTLVRCPSGPAVTVSDIDLDASLSNAGSNAFRWSETGGHWIYNLDTKAITAFLPIDSCLRIDVQQDGTLVSGAQWVIIKVVK
jgi:hypothetical protein